MNYSRYLQLQNKLYNITIANFLKILDTKGSNIIYLNILSIDHCF